MTSFITETEKKHIAATIIRQLGNKAITMIGAKNFVYLTRGIQFQIGGNCKRVNVIQIRLTLADLYDVKYLKRSGPKALYQCTRLHESKGIFADQLHNDIEENTGMKTSLGTMRV